MAKARDINALIEGWSVPPRPSGAVLEGRYARLEPMSAAKHGAAIHQANLADDRIWDYLPYGPFRQQDDYLAWVAAMAGQPDPYFFAIRDKRAGAFVGVASYLRISPEAGSIEVGHINFAPPLQQTRAATEAMFLMMGWAFGAGYRRYEWKCNAANRGSRAAAQRLGFSFEGVFRQAAVIKGRNRDTAWFAAIDSEWPALQAAFEAWLAQENFDADGRQHQQLSALTAPILVADDPALRG